MRFLLSKSHKLRFRSLLSVYVCFKFPFFGVFIKFSQKKVSVSQIFVLSLHSVMVHYL
nr:MAG TPA: hypothetical protein [Caudoviricetes sp.]